MSEISKLRPVDAIRLALEEEKKAYQFYTAVAETAEYASTREMFLFLAEQELKHQRRLEEELSKDFYSEM